MSYLQQIILNPRHLLNLFTFAGLWSVAQAQISPLPFIAKPFPKQEIKLLEKYADLQKAYQEFWTELKKFEAMPDPYSKPESCPYENRSQKILGILTQNVSTPPLFMMQWRAYYNTEYQRLRHFLERVSCQLPEISPTTDEHMSRLYLDACIIYSHDQVCKTGHLDYHCEPYYKTFNKDYYLQLDTEVTPLKSKLIYTHLAKGQSHLKKFTRAHRH